MTKNIMYKKQEKGKKSTEYSSSKQVLYSSVQNRWKLNVKFAKAVYFFGETQTNREFRTRRTNNALFPKSAFTFFIPKYRPMSHFISSWAVTWGGCYKTPSLSFSNIQQWFSLWWPTYKSINRLTLIQQSISNLTWTL